MNLSDLLPLAPEIFLACAGMLLLVAGTFGGAGMARAVNVLAGVSLAVAFGLVVCPVTGVTGELPGGHVGTDGFSQFVKMLLLPAALVSLVLSHDFLKKPEAARFEFPVLVLFATLGMMLMVSARSFLGLYVALELQSLSLYVLAAFLRNDTRSSEAGLKYFVLGALASGLLLYGISLVYGATGSVVFAKLQTVLASGDAPVGLVLGMVFILAGFAFKLAAAPFHMWAPDVYEGAPTPVAAFFASAPKLAAVALLAKVLYEPFGALAAQAQPILMVLALASMAWGAFAAMAQGHIKRLMAYSAIGHIGYALIGLAAGGAEGLQATLLYLVIYLPMTLGAFAVILCARKNGVALEQLSDFAGLSKTRPALAAAMALFMFSMAGVPPLAGFFGKFYVFMAALQAGLLPLAVAGVLLSVVGAFYYLRVIKLMYFDAPRGAAFDPVPGWGTGLVLASTAVLILGFALQPDLAANAVRAATATLAGAA